MKISRWVLEVTLSDRKRSMQIRAKLGVVNISENIRETSKDMDGTDVL